MKKISFLILLLIFIITSHTVFADESDLPSGSLRSDTGTKLNLRIDYSLEKSANSEIVVHVNAYIEYIRLKIVDPRIGTVTVNGQSAEFLTERIWTDSENLHELHVLEYDFKVAYTQDSFPMTIPVTAKWQLGGTYSGKYLDWIEINDSIIVENANFKSSQVKIPETIYKTILDVVNSNTESNTNTGTPDTVEPSAPDNVNVQNDVFQANGTIMSHTGTNLTLRIEWVARQEKDEEYATITAEVYIDFIRMFINERQGTVNIGGVEKSFTTAAMNIPEFENHSLLIATHSARVKRAWDDSVKFSLDAKWYLGANYTDTYLEWVEASGMVILSNKYDDLPDKAAVKVTNISQLPELPNGCEVTSLTIVLRKLGYNVDKLTINDKYLDIGEIGKTNYYIANIGNPRDEGSFGSYSPVIFNCAVKFLNDNGNRHSAYDYTGYNLSEIYYQVSQGNPVIVWVTRDINVKPLVYKTWVVDGVRINWKSPLHCVVLTGYDFANNTVTVSDPMLEENSTTLPMDLFETRWYEMGSQAVVVK